MNRFAEHISPFFPALPDWLMSIREHGQIWLLDVGDCLAKLFGTVSHTGQRSLDLSRKEVQVDCISVAEFE